MTNHEGTLNESIITNSESIEFESKLAQAVNVCKEWHLEYEYFMKKYNCPGNPELTKGIITALEQNSIHPMEHSVWEAFYTVIYGYITTIYEFKSKTKIEDPADASQAIYALETLSDTVAYLQTGDDGFIEFMFPTEEEEG